MPVSPANSCTSVGDVIKHLQGPGTARIVDLNPLQVARSGLDNVRALSAISKYCIQFLYCSPLPGIRPAGQRSWRSASLRHCGKSLDLPIQQDESPRGNGTTPSAQVVMVAEMPHWAELRPHWAVVLVEFRLCLRVTASAPAPAILSWVAVSRQRQRVAA